MIAIAGPNLPHEVLRAAGLHGGPIEFDPNISTVCAERFIESKFAPWAPRVLETWLNGGYDHLDKVLFSRADDTSQRLYYYVCELQRLGHLGGPQPIILDIAKIPRPTSLEQTVEKVRELISDLGVDDAALEEAIAQTNAERSAARPTAEGPSCLIWGSSPQGSKIHDAVRAAGFHPIGMTLAEEWSDLGEPIEENSGDPAEAIARQVHARARGARSFANAAKLLKEAAARHKSEAIVLWRIEEDEAQCWHLPAERKALEELGLPALVLTRRDWLVRDGADQEITDFLAGIEL
ncbi:2-hydroxyacyl-CoA dehydratase family protein [Aurantiacibacter flavus]|uniref:2-hydroxyacyl-CoA dehydratase family protein n=1 Tax=Aurantiacibacter flavus TaxID=3145232 RepID=A0ABV0CRS4_9SPHN